MIRLFVSVLALAAVLQGPALAQATPPAAAPPAAAPPASKPSSCPGNPDALGISRTVQIDTTGGPGFGLEQYKAYDFLQPKEVVLTFDDGPWPTTPAVLEALKFHCVKAIFFPIGKHSLYYPEILKQVAAQGHTIGSHTWSHANLNNKKLTEDARREEIERGFSAVKSALGGPPAPFFRFPALQDPPEMVAYLGQRNVGIFSMDLDSFDFTMRKPEQVVKSIMTKLEKKGKGIILMHDFQQATSKAVPELLKQLKEKDYKVVFMKPKAPVTTIAVYDEQIAKETATTNVGGGRSMSSVIQSVEGQ